MGGNECGFFGHNIAGMEGGEGGRHDEPKVHQKILMKSRVLRNNYLEGLFHMVLLSSTVGHDWPVKSGERKFEMHLR